MENAKIIQIAIDGPSGAGKSTLARALAAQLGFAYVDTGAMYRAIGLYVRDAGIAKDDAEGVVAALDGITLDLKFENGEQKLYLCGEEVGDRIRTQEISLYASAVSALPAVREFLLDMQRGIAARTSVIMDGRDIGTVILPSAQVKLFLSANDEERARRRFEELRAKGDTISYEEVLEGMRLRDKNDSSRAVAPAIPADDAIMLDNSGCTLRETVERALEIIRERI